MKFRNAFTMVELVFVIVIIGILAAIAIPKIAATRDDAKVAGVSQAVATAASEIAGYAVGQGTIEDNMSVMSNVIHNLEVMGEATVDPANLKTDFKIGETSDCLQFVINDGNMDANLTLQYGSSNDDLCDRLQIRFDATEYPIPLRGERIRR